MPPEVPSEATFEEELGELRRRLSRSTAQLERRMAELRNGVVGEEEGRGGPEPPASSATTLEGMPAPWPVRPSAAGMDAVGRDGSPALGLAPAEEREVVARDAPPTPDSRAEPPRSGAHGGSVGALAISRAGSAGPLSTLRYPNHGKLSGDPSEESSAIVGEPAEPLFIAIVAGADELGCTLIRRTLLSERAPRHAVSLYRWQGEVTLDWIGFDAIDDEAGRSGGRVDLLVLSDQLAGGAPCGATARSVQRAALRARLAFPRTYLVGLSQDLRAPGRPGHPFGTIEAQAGRRGVPVFDDHLIGEVTAPKLSRLLIGFAESDRFELHRKVWRRSAGSEAPVATPKAAPSRASRG